MSQRATERRRFGMHQNLLYDVITKQAGSLQKAILEGVMNSVDAQSTEVRIDLSDRQVMLQDNGHGFRSKEEIEVVFEVFGAPQEAEKTFSRFHMGRGQLFSFGVNTWHTQGFVMEVDVKNKGLDYELSENNPFQEGCKVEIALYDPLLPSQLDAIQRDLKTWVSWLDIPVYLNGRKISTPPTDHAWDLENDDAYMKFSDRGSLDVYNQGVLVCKYPAYTFGTGGVVVSKHRLDVNFARNDIQSTCSIWRRIGKILRQHTQQEVLKKPKTTDAERQHVAENVKSGALLLEDAYGLKILTDVEGRQHTLESLYKNPRSHMSVAPRGHRVSASAHQQRLAFVLAQETLDRFDVDSLAEFVEILKRRAQEAIERHPRMHWKWTGFLQYLERLTLVDMATFQNVIGENFETLPEKALNVYQKRGLLIAQSAMPILANHCQQHQRHLHAGKSDIAHAWTDGTRNIWINIEQLRLLQQGYAGCARIAGLLLHEFLHEGPDTGTHEHDTEFYQRFHDMVLDSNILGQAADRMMNEMAREMRKSDRKVGQKAAFFEDVSAQLAARATLPKG